MTTQRVIALAVAALAIGTAGCSSPSNHDSATTPETGATAIPETDDTATDAADHTADAAEMGHIHALQINPADQTLYIATHHGVFRLADNGTPQLVGAAQQDFMGFTVAGPDHFLASGHPGAGDTDQPADLGLIESTDGGQTWNSVSLSGQADFHSLDYRHGLVYGRDSHTGQVMTSQDKTTWDAQRPIDAVDLAVSPSRPDELLVTTANALQRSLDAGSTYQPVASAPLLMFLSWPEDGPLLGVDTIGTLYVSEDAGQTWEARTSVGQRPQAVLAAGDGEVYLATDAAIYRSTDNATTLTKLTDLH